MEVQSWNPILLGVIGTVFTWLLTALGSSVVFIIPQGLAPSKERKILDFSLGFSAGVMLAASFWSLLIPALERGEETMPSKLGFLPAVVGFLTGCFVVYYSERFLPDPDSLPFMIEKPKIHIQDDLNGNSKDSKNLRQRRRPIRDNNLDKKTVETKVLNQESMSQRIMLLIIAMTIHNFPEGLAVGVAFGSVPLGKASFSQALVLTIAIGLQNFPEGLAVSLPLQRQIKNKRTAFFYGQLSGFVEIFGGFFGAYLVDISTKFLPYALGFAAGAMIFVVVDSIIPESHSQGNRTFATWGVVIGFLLMMVMDVALE